MTYRITRDKLYGWNVWVRGVGCPVWCATREIAAQVVATTWGLV